MAVGGSPSGRLMGRLGGVASAGGRAAAAVSDLRQKLSSRVEAAPGGVGRGGGGLASSVVVRPREREYDAAPPARAVDKQSVTSLLASLGLSKYAEPFQREEIDMVALKRVTECANPSAIWDSRCSHLRGVF